MPPGTEGNLEGGFLVPFDGVRGVVPRRPTENGLHFQFRHARMNLLCVFPTDGDHEYLRQETRIVADKSVSAADEACQRRTVNNSSRAIARLPCQRPVS